MTTTNFNSAQYPSPSELNTPAADTPAPTPSVAGNPFRSLPEWIGRTPDSAVPPRVRLRVFQRYAGRCQCGCNRLIRPGEAWECEDTIAIINGGQRRESNLKPWLAEHHKAKTKQDVAEKSRVYRKAAKHAGVELKPRQKIQSRGFAKFEAQRTASRPIRKWSPSIEAEQ
jgi:5-methylcytosine-specific restriction enzyme A